MLVHMYLCTLCFIYRISIYAIYMHIHILDIVFAYKLVSYIIEIVRIG